LFSGAPGGSPTSSLMPLSISLKGATQTGNIDIYNTDQRYAAALARLRSSKEVFEEDRTSILSLVDHMLAKGNGKLRATKYIGQLMVAARIAGNPLGKLDKLGVERLIGQINTSDYSDNTKHDYRVVIKRYFQWIRGFDETEHEYPDEVRWIKTTLKKGRLLPESLLSIEDIRKIVAVAENPRDRALVLMHYESGCRIGETLSLRIRNVAFDKYGAVLRVDGKTGPRRVRVVAATPALAAWLDIHPFKDDENAPLWIGVGTVGRYKSLNYEAARICLKRLVIRAGLNKRVYTHLLRHSRATELANDLTESQLKEMFGWVQGSDMPSTYVHLSGRDVDTALLKTHGIIVDSNETHSAILTTITCPRCKQKTGPESQFCPSCGLAMSISTALKLEDERAKYDGLMDKLIVDSEFRALLERKIGDLFGAPPP
jgi:integrase/recombinase XerD